MSGQGSGSGSAGGGSGNGSTNSLMQVSSLPGGYQPMDCESSPRQTTSRRAITTGAYPSVASSSSAIAATAATGISTGGPISAPTSMQSIDNSLIPSSLGSYNSLILPGIPHLPAMMTSPMISHQQQQNFYNYGYPTADTHGIVRQPSAVSTGKQRDPDREDSPMVGVCVQQSPVAIH